MTRRIKAATAPVRGNADNIIAYLRTFHEISKAINSSLDIDEVISIILSRTSQLMGSERVLILTYDKKKKSLHLQSSIGLTNSSDKPVIHNVQPVEHCIAGKDCIIRLRDILDKDAYAEAMKSIPEIGRMIFTPLEMKGMISGLLGISGRKGDFSKIEMEIFCSLGSQAAIAIENAGLYKKLKNTFLHTAEALADAINSRDPYTGGHTKRVERLSLLLADAAGMSNREKETLLLAAVLHDIGKIGMEDVILRKKQKLTVDEVVLMKRHPEIGAGILGHVRERRGLVPAVRHHHERYDGKGYPDGLKGEDIPLASRIIAIVDAFDALTTERPYMKAVSKEKALEVLMQDKGSHFDPNLVDLFCEAVKDGRGSGL